MLDKVEKELNNRPRSCLKFNSPSEILKDGKKIAKPSGSGDDPTGNQADQLDEFLNKMENPDYWRTVLDRQTGEKVVLSDEDIEIIKRLAQSQYVSNTVEEFETSTFFTKDEMKMPLSGRPEHKRSFIPSKWEKLQVSRF